MDEKKVYDPVGIAVILSSNSQGNYMDGPTFNIDITPVIAHPTLVIEATDGTMHRFYIRSIEENTVLVKTRKIGDAFIVNHYQVNPSIEQIQELLKGGNLVYKSELK